MKAARALVVLLFALGIGWIPVGLTFANPIVTRACFIFAAFYVVVACAMWITVDRTHRGLQFTAYTGLPRSILSEYARVAVRHARVSEVDTGVWFADIAGLDGAWGDGDSRDEALAELEEGIVGWAAVKLRHGQIVPVMDGFDINPRTTR